MLFLQLSSNDRAKCIHLPEILPWNRNHPQEIQSASSTTLTSAEPSTTRIFTVTNDSIRKNGAGYSALICFTSKLKHSLSGSLPRHTTIFQAEGFSILAALDWIFSTRPLPSQNYEISSDSKSALAASTPSASTKSSQPFSSIVKILATHCPNIIFFIPSHSGLPGNYMTDSIAKSATRSWSSHHPSLPMTKSYAKDVILNYINTLWGDEWKSMKAGKSVWAFFPHSSQCNNSQHQFPFLPD
jgi:ribonuclease HI